MGTQPQHLIGPWDKFSTIAYEDRLKMVCETVKDKSARWWSMAPEEKRISVIQLGRMLEKQRTKVVDIKSHLCSKCGKPNKIQKQRTICYSCCHKLYDKDTLEGPG